MRGGVLLVDAPGAQLFEVLADGDEIIIRARARRDGAVSIGFGDVRARILPAR